MNAAVGKRLDDLEWIVTKGPCIVVVSTRVMNNKG